MLSGLAMTVEDELDKVVEKISKDARELQARNETLQAQAMASRKIEAGYKLYEVESKEQKQTFKSQFFNARGLTEEKYDDQYNLKVEKINNSGLNARYELEKDILTSKHIRYGQSPEIEEKQLWSGPYANKQDALWLLYHGYIGQWMTRDYNAKVGGYCASMAEQVNPTRSKKDEYWIQWSVMTGTSSEYTRSWYQLYTLPDFCTLAPQEDSLYNPTIQTYGIFEPSQMTPKYFVQESPK